MRRKKSIPVLAIVLTVCFLGVGAFDIFFDGLVRSTVRTTLGPTIVSVMNVGDAFAGGWLVSRQTLLSERAALRKQVDALLPWQETARSLQDENTALRELLSMDARAPGVGAEVISSIYSSAFGTIVLKLPSTHTVVAGDLVVAGGDAVIGEISEVSVDTAVVTLLSAPGVENEVILAKSAVTAEGYGGGQLVIRVPRALMVAEGDLVTLGRTPLVVGLVRSISVSPADAEQELLIRSDVNLSTVRVVRIIKRSL